MRELHLYEFHERIQKKIYCFLEEKFRIGFFKNFLEKYKTKVNASKKLSVSEDKIRGWISGRNVRGVKNRIIPIQASILFSIAKDLNYDLDTIEKNIISFKTYSQSRILKNPKLPVKFNYDLGRLIGSCLGDGHLTKYSTIVYVNTCKELIKKMKLSVQSLGEITVKEDCSAHIKYLIIPNTVGVLLNGLGVPTGNKTKIKEKIRIPKIVFDGPLDFKIGVISSLLDDEGSVICDGKIKFKQILPIVVDDLRCLLNGLGIITSRTLRDKENNFSFYVYRKSERLKIREYKLFTHPDKIERLNRIIGGEKIG